MVQQHALNRRAPGGLRRWAFIGLVLTVVAVHGCVTAQLSDRMADFSADAAMPKRVEVAYVRELAPSAPPAVAPRAAAPAPTKPRRQVAKAQPAASAASSPATSAVVVAAASAPDVPAERQALAASEPAAAAEPLAESPPAKAAASVSAAATDAPAPNATEPNAPVVAAAPAASAASTPVFEWPVSTRMSYQLTGMVRGEVNGQAQVEWVRTGSRYQVHLDVTLGLPIAPLVTRRMTSDGDITEQGLAPRRYDEDTKAAFRDRRRVTLLFEPGEVVFSNGQRYERQPGMQDAASQFVQFVWIFSTRPELLRRGNTLELPLALPRSVDRWVYDVQEEETLHTPFGPLQAFHVKPRRMSGRAGELRADIWFAPTLRYLPVRIRIHQDADTFIDLMLSRRPELAGP